MFRTRISLPLLQIDQDDRLAAVERRGIENAISPFQLIVTTVQVYAMVHAPDHVPSKLLADAELEQASHRRSVDETLAEQQRILPLAKLGRRGVEHVVDVQRQ